MDLMEEVRTAFAEYGMAIHRYRDASIRRARAREALKEALARGLLSGEITGRNAEEREAQARRLYPHLYRELAEAEEELLEAQARLDFTRARTEEVSLLVRLATMGKG